MKTTLKTAALLACLATSTLAQSPRHLMIVIDAFAENAPVSIASQAASALGSYSYGDRLSVRSVDGSLIRDLHFNYGQNLNPADLDQIVGTLIGLVAKTDALPGNWPAAVEDASTYLDCTAEDTTLLLVSSLEGGFRFEGGTEVNQIEVDAFEQGALDGCRLVAAGVGHGARAGQQPLYQKLVRKTAAYWGADYAQAR
jgi:hypothetical protein